MTGYVPPTPKPSVSKPNFSVDPDGNVYVTGTYRLSVDFDPGPGREVKTSPGDEDDCFVAKYDRDGNFQWVRTWGGSRNNQGPLDVKAIQGGVYVLGYLSGRVDFDPFSSAGDLEGEGRSENVYLCKYNTDGDFQWARNWERGITNGDTNCWPQVYTDDAGMVYARSDDNWDKFQLRCFSAAGDSQ